jgi:MoaA/NifB/PqqE/SkfB family radical SAM enzyme
MELIPTARKVYRDFRFLAAREVEGPAILAALERILHEADRWQDRSAGVGPSGVPLVETLPPGLGLPVEEVIEWALGLAKLFTAVNHLGTYCHFNLKEQRRVDAETDGSAGQPAPLLSSVGYQALKLKNSLLNNLEILLARTNISSYPRRLELDPTNECNLRCRGCRHGITKDFHHTEMRRQYVEILSESFPFVDYMYLMGTGEPTMSSTLPKLTREAARHGVKLDMLTNGTILERTTLPLDSFFRIGISVDGASEETMRALRPVAPLAHVLSALTQLRAQAPQATIYSKVTVSRMNYDELPELVEKLAEAGVNEVIVHSLDVFHPVHEAIQVRASDRAHMSGCVEAAAQAAERRGVAFANALNFEASARNDTNGLTKIEMFQLLQDSPLPILKVRELATILETLERHEFKYYPDAFLRAKGITPPSTGTDISATIAAANIDTIDGLIQGALQEARALTANQVRIPYCFIPWKMPIVDPDGRARACCHLPGFLGDLDQGERFHDLWSGPGYVQLREAMFQTESLPDVCKTCQAFDRSVFSEETVALADLLGVPIRQAPHYPAPIDVGGVLQSAGVRNPFEALGATRVDAEHFTIPPGAQVLVRFPNPRTPSGVYYQGRFQITGGRLLVGVKPLWESDLWNYMLEPRYLELLGEWIGLPMPPLTVDFSSCQQEECCLFLWAPADNQSDVQVIVNNFAGVVCAPGPSHGDALQRGHFWSGNTAKT